MTQTERTEKLLHKSMRTDDGYVWRVRRAENHARDLARKLDAIAEALTAPDDPNEHWRAVDVHNAIRAILEGE